MIAQSKCNLNYLLFHDHHLIRSKILAVRNQTSNEIYVIVIFKAVNKHFSNLSFKELFNGHILNCENYSMPSMTTYHIHMPSFQYKVLNI